MQDEHKVYFDNVYMPYIVKWGKLISWISIICIFIPGLYLYLVKGIGPNVNGVISGSISAISSMLAWYIVDPLTLYPILTTSGMYMTYLGGNSKEIRIPATLAALNATQIEPGTKEASLIATIAISISILVSVSALTIIALAGQYIISILPDSVIRSLGYLLPSLFGAMWIQRVRQDIKSALIIIPIVIGLKVLNMNGLFAVLPFGGGYAQILLSVIVGSLVARSVNKNKL